VRQNWATQSSELVKAIRAHRKRVSDNNGIKPSNLNWMLIPLGFRDTFFSSQFRAKMQELGEKRGQVAHGSGALVPLIPTGSGELNRFRDIEQGLCELDRFAPRLLAPIWR
jgi:hypothetical protein